MMKLRTVGTGEEESIKPCKEREEVRTRGLAALVCFCLFSFQTFPAHHAAEHVR